MSPRARIAARTAPLLTVLGLLTATPSALAYPVAQGSSELRPLLGVTAEINNQVSQFLMGLDYGYSLNGPLQLVVGGWFGVGKDYFGLQAHVGVKYRFLRLHPRIAPFVAGGGGFQYGRITADAATDKNYTAFSVRFGGGVDFFPTETIVPGVQVMFDLGPRFTPGVDFQGATQITFGCAFLF